MKRISLLLAGSIAALIMGCATPPEPIEVSTAQEIDAVVVAVDVEDRVIVLRGPEGNEMAMRAGPEVRNLEQVQPGDILRVGFYSGYTVAMAEPGSAGTDVDFAAGRRPEGERPGVAAGTTTRATVEILSVAKDGTSVSFRDSEGRIQSISVVRDDGQAFARKLKAGDLVDLSYSEAVAISVDAPE